MTFLQKLIDKMRAKDLSETSIKLYLNNIKKLNDGKDIKNLSFLKNIDDIKSLISNNWQNKNTQRNYLISVVAILSLAGPEYKSLYKEYHLAMMNMNRYLNDLAKKNEKSDTQKKNWIEFDDVKKILENLKSKVDDFVDKKKITKSQYTTLLHYTILALYTLTPPRRNKDYQNMLAVRSKKELGDLTDINKKYNYLDFDNKEFIFNNFKTKKNHGQQIIKIEDDLWDVINLYLKFYPNKLKKTYIVPFLIDFNGEHLDNINDITNILNTIFDKKIGSSMLRHIYLSSKYGDVKKEQQKDAEAMAHSVNTQQNNYVKSD